MEDSIYLETYNLDLHKLDVIWDDLKNENPILFYINGFKFSKNTQYIVRIWPTYTYPLPTITRYIELVEDKVHELYIDLKIESLHEAEKIESAVHDWIVNNAVWYKDENNYRIPKVEYHSVLGCLLNGLGVCSSISLTMSLLVNCFGGECYVLCGYTGEYGDVVSLKTGHAWNIIKVNGHYTHTDVTWDLHSQREFYNMDNEACSKTHSWERVVYCPTQKPSTQETEYHH